MKKKTQRKRPAPKRARFELPSESIFAKNDIQARQLLLAHAIDPGKVSLAYDGVAKALQQCRNFESITFEQLRARLKPVLRHAIALDKALQRIPPADRIGGLEGLHEFIGRVHGHLDDMTYERPEDILLNSSEFSEERPIKAEEMIIEFKSIEARMRELYRTQRRMDRGTQNSVLRRYHLLSSLTTIWFKYSTLVRDAKCAPVSWRGAQEKYDGPLLRFVADILQFEGASVSGTTAVARTYSLGKDLAEILRER